MLSSPPRRPPENVPNRLWACWMRSTSSEAATLRRRPLLAARAAPPPIAMSARPDNIINDQAGGGDALEIEVLAVLNVTDIDQASVGTSTMIYIRLIRSAIGDDSDDPKSFIYIR
eukprot:scaffold117618_cov35-Prasinocladus_malaysianus.AAC.3